MTDSVVTALLRAVGEGDSSALDRLIPLIQNRLHEMASYQMRQERTGHTLQPTALVNEAYIRLVSGDARWENRAHFFGAASRAMRRVLVDHARKRLAEKRGGNLDQVTFEDLEIATDEPDVDVLALDEALNELEELDPRITQIVHLRYFVGLNIEETAELLEISPATVKRDWQYGRAWLYARMTQGTED